MHSGPHITPNNASYLSILAWPSGWSHDDRVESLVASVGMDYDLAIAEAEHQSPSVVCMIETDLSKEILRVLHDRGVFALAIPHAEIHRYPDPEPIKRIARFPATSPTAFAADDNDEPAWTFTTDNIRLVVFGRVRSVRSRSETQGVPYSPGPHGASRMQPRRRIRIDRMEVDEILDLHLVQNNSPRLIRLTGQRTLIRSLDEIDQKPSLLNPPDPVELLEPYLDGLGIDQDFESFTPPRRIRLEEDSSKLGIKHRTLESFAFYSVWRAAVNRALRA
ncbi:MAG: hypothetical protein JJ974_01550 [Phycisphaerales bacterium]|nr:hypothetical protein [Phycisphaerales bacterium]